MPAQREDGVLSLRPTPSSFNMKRVAQMEFHMDQIHIEMRSRRLINTDPQRRCYNGCHFKSELIWTPWATLELNVPNSKLAERLAFWRDLNDGAISARGESARSEYRACTVGATT